jgi:hypothetical protein
MTADEDRPAAMRLEGLVLRDGQGWIYEVPCLVIERYRVTDERAAELTARPAGSARQPVSAATLASLAWTVQGGVYVTTTSAGEG